MENRIERIEQEIDRFYTIICTDNERKVSAYDDWLCGFLHGMQMAGVITPEEYGRLYREYSPIRKIEEAELEWEFSRI